jgi:hypothetical protein
LIVDEPEFHPSSGAVRRIRSRAERPVHQVSPPVVAKTHNGSDQTFLLSLISCHGRQSVAGPQHRHCYGGVLQRARLSAQPVHDPARRAQFDENPSGTNAIAYGLQWTYCPTEAIACISTVSLVCDSMLLQVVRNESPGQLSFSSLDNGHIFRNWMTSDFERSNCLLRLTVPAKHGITRQE